MRAVHAHAAVKTDAREDARELQRVPGRFRSALARGGEKSKKNRSRVGPVTRVPLPQRPDTITKTKEISCLPENRKLVYPVYRVDMDGS